MFKQNKTRNKQQTITKSQEIIKFVNQKILVSKNKLEKLLVAKNNLFFKAFKLQETIKDENLMEANKKIVLINNKIKSISKKIQQVNHDIKINYQIIEAEESKEKLLFINN